MLTPLPDEVIKICKLARAKSLSESISRALLLTNSDLSRKYVSTLYCASELNEYHGGKLSGNYCKQRWCVVCNRIRTAQNIESYLNGVCDLKNPCMVTLTVVSCKISRLSSLIKQMHANFRKIKDKLRKKGITISGVRKIECTFNPVTNEYHPHFHCIIESMASSQSLYSEWLHYFPTSYPVAQKIQTADLNSMKEVFKYVTKILSKTGNGSERFFPHAMDNVFRAFRGKRTFQNFGTLKVQRNTFSSENAKDSAVVDVHRWNARYRNWFSEHNYGCGLSPETFDYSKVFFSDPKKESKFQKNFSVNFFIKQLEDHYVH